MKNRRQRMAVALLSVLLLATSLGAKDNELRLVWKDLPQSLVGQKVRVLQIDNRKVSGKLVRIEPDALILSGGAKSRTIARADVQQIEPERKRHRTRGQIIGIAVGAGVGIAVLCVALTYTHNENGANSDAIVGATAGAAVAATLLGYWAGRESDSDRTIIHVVQP